MPNFTNDGTTGIPLANATPTGEAGIALETRATIQNTHQKATAAHGATGAVVGTTNTQTLTNKTISGGSNTITNIPNSATTATTATTASTIVLRGTSGEVNTLGISLTSAGLGFFPADAYTITASPYIKFYSGIATAAADLSAAWGLVAGAFSSGSIHALGKVLCEDVLQFGDAYGAGINKIDLFGGTNQYGFGIDASTLNYYSDGAHVWNKGGTVQMTLASNGDLAPSGTITANGNLSLLVPNPADDLSLRCFVAAGIVGIQSANYANSAVNQLDLQPYGGDTYVGRNATSNINVNGTVTATAFTGDVSGCSGFPSQIQDLNSVLTTGSGAGGYGITDLASITFSDSTTQTTAYTGSIPELSSVLSAGTGAGGYGITNLSSVAGSSGLTLSAGDNTHSITIDSANTQSIEFRAVAVNMNDGGGSGGGTLNMDGGNISNAMTVAVASIFIGGTQVVGSQQGAIADTDDDATNQTTAINAILAALRAHGLIAT